MKSDNFNYKYGLYSKEEKVLLPFTTVNLNIKIENKIPKLNLIHIYKNPYNKNIDTYFFIPKECIKIFNSLKIEYNNKTYEGIIANKSEKVLIPAIQSEKNDIDLLEFNHIRKIYFYFELKDIIPEQEIKIELNYIHILDIENNKINFIIPHLYIPKNSNGELSYNYKYEINVTNLYKIKNIFCNMKKYELIQKNDNEFTIKYFNIRKKSDILKNFKLEYEIEDNNEPNLIIMKHPLYENDYACKFNFIPKSLIKGYNNNKKENIQDFTGNILILLNINNPVKNFKKITKSIICLLKSLPENVCCFNVFYKSPLFNECMPVNDKNIKYAIFEIEKYESNSMYITNYLTENIKYLRKEKMKNTKNTKLFMIGDDYNDLNLIDEISNFGFRIYTIKSSKENGSNAEYNNKIKEISIKTNGNYYIYNNIDELPDKLIELYEESITDIEYIDNINISFVKPDNNLIYYLDKYIDLSYYNKGYEAINLKKRYSINSNIEIYTIMTKNNDMKIEFEYAGKKYEYLYNINVDNCIIDDTLHKIIYNKYYYRNIFLSPEKIDLLNKYQILTNFNELYIDLIDNKKSLEEKINTKRKKDIILKQKGIQLNLTIQTLIGKRINIFAYNKYLIKEIKIILDLLENIPYTNVKFVYDGKGLFDDRILDDYNIKNNSKINSNLGLTRKIGKYYLDINYNNDIYLLIKNQKMNGLWESNEENFKKLKINMENFDNMYDNYKEIYLKSFLKEYNKDIFFSILVISYLNCFPYQKRYKYIIQKTVDYLKENIEEYNESKQRLFESYLFS